MKKTIWSNLDHAIRKNRSHWPPMTRVLVALSGGVDSVVLLTVFARLQKSLNLEVLAAHVHHGPGTAEQGTAEQGTAEQGTAEQKKWRDETQEWCQNLSQSLQIRFLSSEPSKKELHSEDELRSFRYEELENFRKQTMCDFILTAHHAEDVLETRLLRLLRGTGPQGLDAIKEFDVEKKLWRPFLNTQKSEILQYANENQLKYQSDPSNISSDPMRNWVRNELLPQIEARQKGMTQCLARSLQLIVDALRSHQVSDYELKWDEGPNGISLEIQHYLLLSPIEQRRALARAILQLGVKNYSQGQIIEIQKHLDNRRKIHKFTIASTHWNVDAKQIYVNKIAPSESDKRL